MHPNKAEIKAYILDGASGEARKALAEHLRTCEFCTELAEEIRLQEEALQQAWRDLPTARLEQMKKQLVNRAFGPSVIRLKELKSETFVSGLLAADGRTVGPRWEHLRTLYCESPDVILRIVRDTELSKTSLQVIADDPSLYGHVMVNVPDRGLQMLTDENGHAEIEPGLIEKAGDAPWQINLPEAVFSLETLDFDPEKTEYKSETVLTTEKDDRIRIAFEGKTVGKQFSIEILHLDGKTDFDPVHVVMMTDQVVETWQAEPGVGRKITLKDKARKITFRLYYR